MQIMVLPRTKLLLVDDEQLVLSTLLRLFRADYDVQTASSGEEALKMIRQQAFHVVISDQRMPGMKGVDLLRQIKEISPQTMRILLTGYSDLTAIVDSVNEGEVFRYITKPWKNEALRYTVALAAEAAMNSLDDVAHSHGRAGLVIDLRLDDPARGSPERDSGPLTQPPQTLPPQDHHPVDVLLIDTDDRFLHLVRLACNDGRVVHHATSLEQAIRMLELHHRIGVIISEVHIGSDDITQLLTSLKRYHANIVTMVASGYSDANVVIKLINEGQIFRFIGKPYGAERVRDLVGRASKLHKSMRQFSTLAERHRVEEESAEAQATTPGAPPRPGPAARGMLGRIAGLFRRG